MEDLLEAIKIFVKYSKDKYPTNCTHDILYVAVEENLVSDEDLKRLEELGFYINVEFGGFESTRFGSC